MKNDDDGDEDVPAAAAPPATSDQQQLAGEVVPSFATKVPFGALVDFFERCIHESRPTKKRLLLQLFFKNYHSDDFFPLMRLLLPQFDKERQTYGMKEANIARFYVEILGISDRSEDGFRLLHWRKPVAGSDAAGDFGSAVALSLKSRCPERGTMTIASVNEALDRLSTATERKDKLAVLSQMLRSTTALEQKWLVRVILKELRMGMSEMTVFGFFHPDANELYNMTADLRRVCEELKSPQFHLDHGSSMKVFHPIRPMLAARHPPEDVVRVLEGKPFVIEKKYDGERIQVHKQGDRIEFFSRHANNVSHLYAPHMASVIRERINVTDCILDGELMVWDELLQRFEDFGRIKAFVTSARGVDVEKDGVNKGKQLCYVVFDILFVKGSPITELTLDQRYNVLKRIVNPKPKVLEVVEQKPARQVSDVLEALDTAILNREEGVMLKALDSPYVPGDRKGKWIKIKPEYLDGLGDSLDLVIVGGYFGKGRRGNNVSHFMVAVPSPGEEVTPDGQRIYLSLAKVGSGYSDYELRKLQDDLRDHWRYFDSDPPQFLKVVEGKDCPDVWIEPKFSRVLQIKAAQIVPSDKYRTGVTLRFPRVERIRPDKGIADATTLLEIQQLRDTFQGRYAKRQLADLGQGGAKFRKRRKMTDDSGAPAAAGTRSPEKLKTPRGVWTVHNLYRDTDTRDVVKASSALEGKELCVMNGSEAHPKEELEKIIVKHGGTKVQHPTETTLCVLAARESVKVRNVITMKVCDVVDISWLLQCDKESRFVPLGPKFIVFATDETKEKLQAEFDRFGDSFTEEATPESLKEVFAQVDRQLRRPAPGIQAQPPDAPAPQPSLSLAHDETGTDGLDQSSFDAQEIDISRLEAHYLKNTPWWSIFRPHTFYVDIFATPGVVETKVGNSPLDPFVAVIKFFSGTVLDRITPETTHIIVDETDKSRLRAIRRLSIKAQEEPPHVEKKIVSSKWIQDSIRSGEDLVEDAYSQIP